MAALGKIATISVGKHVPVLNNGYKKAAFIKAKLGIKTSKATPRRHTDVASKYKGEELLLSESNISDIDQELMKHLNREGV